MANHPAGKDSTGSDKQDDKQLFPQNRGSGFGADPKDDYGSGEPERRSGAQAHDAKDDAGRRKDEDDRGGNTVWTADGTSKPA